MLSKAVGVPVATVIDGANRLDMKLAREMFEAIAVARPEPDDDQPQGACLEKGYDSLAIRELLVKLSLEAHIRARGEEAQDLKRHPDARARRWVVERDHRWLNCYRGILIRRYKKQANYLACLLFACGLSAFQQAGLFG